MRITIFSICLLLVLAPALAQEKEKITHEDLWLMNRAGAPKISPDGKWIVYSVTEAAYDEKEVVSDLWIVPASGSMAPKKITAGKAAESGYEWSPDSRYIAFTARRDGEETSQVYLLNIKQEYIAVFLFVDGISGWMIGRRISLCRILTLALQKIFLAL